MVELLLSNGADIHPLDEWGSTPLDEVVRRGHKEIVDLVRKHGANT